MGVVVEHRRKDVVVHSRYRFGRSRRRVLAVAAAERSDVGESRHESRGKDRKNSVPRVAEMHSEGEGVGGERKEHRAA